MIRVIVADDHPLVRDAVARLLNGADGIEVIGMAADGQQAVELVKDLDSDIAVMDVAMPCLNGIDATKRIGMLNKDVKVLLISIYVDTHLVETARENGAYGYLPKQILANRLIATVRALYEGRTYFFTESQPPKLNNHSSRNRQSSGSPAPAGNQSLN